MNSEEFDKMVKSYTDKSALAKMVVAFSDVMYHKLEVAYENKTDSYREMQAEQLANKLEIKRFQLDAALWAKQSPETVALLAADIANYAMLVAGRYFAQNEPTNQSE